MEEFWTIEYHWQHDDEDKVEWEIWEVTNGIKQFNTPDKSHAEWLANLLNGNHQERKV